MALNIAVVGATGNVGTEMLAILAESDLTVDNVYAVASRRSVGREVSFGDKTLKCVDLEQFDFSKVDMVLMSAGVRGIRFEAKWRRDMGRGRT